MARRITYKDVQNVAEAIIRDSDVILAIRIDPGSVEYSRSWMFTFEMEHGREYQHSFWNYSLNTTREAHIFLRGMAHMLELQAKAAIND